MDTTMTDASVFDEATFTIIPTSLSPERVQELTHNIESSGGTVFPFDASAGRLKNLQEILYIVTATTDFPDYYRALDLMINVVKPTFIDACLDSGKLKNPRSYNPDSALFMSEVVVCCGDIPEGDQDAIAGGVIAMGGQCSTGLSKTTTHLVALSMDEKRCVIVKQKKLNVRIVLPHWFDDCLKVGRRISERPYLLPDPEILDIEAGAIPAPKTNLDIRDATNPEPMSPPVSTPPAHLEDPRSIKAFADKRVKLGADLNINARLRGTIAGLVEAGGGVVTENIDEADIYVCNYRDGDDYITASQAKKDVGNLSWLYYLITHDEWTNPMRRMLHYPRPRNGVPGFKKYKISISSYTGEARVFLENLIRAAGAEFTKTFKQDNTHLIAAHKTSEKYEAAQEWNVSVVNNLWLEDCYACCKNLPMTHERYTYFPTRTNMGEILGSTEIDRVATENMFFPTPRRSQPAKPKAQTDDVPASSVKKARGNSDLAAPKSPLANKTTKRKAGADVATPAPSRRTSGKENETPGTTGSRSAKLKATSALHNAADDINKFEQERKRKGGVIHGGRRRKGDEVSEQAKGKKRESSSSKRSIDEVDVDGTTEEDEATEPATKSKKARKGPLTPIKYRMLISKDERWADNKDKESKEKARLRDLGLFIADDFKNTKVDLLCAPRIVRTEKFVSAFACGPTLVSSKFIDDALKNNRIPAPEKFPLDTTDYEREHGLNIDECLTRARQNKQRLLKDWQIFCTPGVAPGFETFKKIIQANGGTCQAYRGRNAKLTASRREIDVQPKEVSQNLVEDDGDVLYLISEPSRTEMAWWKPFREFAEKNDMVPRIVNKEWLLCVAIAQRMMWKKEWELSEERA